MPYLTVEELKEKTNIEEIKNYEDDVFLENLIIFCSYVIDSHVGYTFEKEENLTLYVDGEGDSKIYLPKRIFNLIEVKDIDTNYVYNINDIRIINDGQSLFHKNDIFPQGYENIQVTGDYGFEQVPEDIKYCTLVLCHSYFYILNDVDILRNQASPFKSEKIGDYSYELKDKINKVTGETTSETGNLIVDQILQKYVDNFYIGVV